MKFLKIIAALFLCSAPPALGCSASPDGPMQDADAGLVGAEGPTDEGPVGIAVQASTRARAQEVTCAGGWPGSRPCHQQLGDGGEIEPGSIGVSVVGSDGSDGHSATLADDGRHIDLWANIREGDIWNPGKNTTTFLVVWLCK